MKLEWTWTFNLCGIATQHVFSSYLDQMLTKINNFCIITFWTSRRADRYKNMPVLCTARVMKACIWWKTSARVFSKSTKRELGCSSTKVFKCMENRISQDMQNRWMTLNVSQGHRKCLYSRGYISLPITGCSNDVCILHRFWDVITYFPKLKEVTWPLAHTFRGWCS